MRKFVIPQTNLSVTRLAYGNMQIGGSWDDRAPLAEDRAKATRVIARALECGINFFDHADIYCRGKSEMVFGDALRELRVNRTDVILQSKCGIRFGADPNPGDPARYDFSCEHITHAVEGSLRRLRTDYLDILLLHRPDALVEPREVARAFDELRRAGKVRYFGVSNHTPGQIALLRKFVTQPLVVNQLELNLWHHELISEGLLANNDAAHYTNATGILEYCRAQEMILQAWAPVAGGRLMDPPRDADAGITRAAALVARLAQLRNTSREAIALAWLLRHPAPIQPILGTTNPERVAASCLADEIELTREEWYALLEAARGEPAP